MLNSSCYVRVYLSNGKIAWGSAVNPIFGKRIDTNTEHVTLNPMKYHINCITYCKLLQCIECFVLLQLTKIKMCCSLLNKFWTEPYSPFVISPLETTFSKPSINYSLSLVVSSTICSVEMITRPLFQGLLIIVLQSMGVQLKSRLTKMRRAKL